MQESLVQALAEAIKRQEGWRPGSMSFRNNNPGNLRFAGQRGALIGAGGFARFASPEAGMEALKAQIRLDAQRKHDAAGRPVRTVAELVHSWAPPDENDTPAYVASVVEQTGFAADTPLLG